MDANKGVDMRGRKALNQSMSFAVRATCTQPPQLATASRRLAVAVRPPGRNVNVKSNFAHPFVTPLRKLHERLVMQCNRIMFKLTEAG